MKILISILSSLLIGTSAYALPKLATPSSNPTAFAIAAPEELEVGGHADGLPTITGYPSGKNQRNVLVFPFPEIINSTFDVNVSSHRGVDRCAAKIQLKLTQTDEGIKAETGVFQAPFKTDNASDSCSFKTAKAVVAGTMGSYTIVVSAE